MPQWVFSDRFLREYVALPVYMLDHSGQTVSTTPFSCPRDSGLLGIIDVPIADAKKEYGWRTVPTVSEWHDHHRSENAITYRLRDERDYKRAIIDFIAAMTDNFAIKAYHEIIAF